MYRIDTDGNVANLFDEGDPLVPRNPTKISADWMNEIQEELMNLLTVGAALDIEGPGAITPVKGVRTQIESAILHMVVNLGSNQTIDGRKRFVNKIEVLSNQTVAIAAKVVAFGSDLAVAALGGGAALATVLGAAAGSAVGGDKAGVVGGSVGGYGVIAAGDAGATPVYSAFRVVPQQQAPSSAAMGDLYVQIGGPDAGKLFVYNGSAWVVVGTQT